MSDKQIHSEARDVTAEDDVVHVNGPDSVDVALTPEAAEGTSDRLLKGARKAQGQKHFEKLRRGLG